MKSIRRVLRALPIIICLLVATCFCILWLVRVHWRIKVPGEVRADRFEVVRPRIDGVVLRVLVRAGDEVQPGQVLLEIDDQNLVDEITALKSQLTEIRATLAGTRRSRDILAASIQPLQSTRQKSELDRREINARRQAARVEEVRAAREAALARYRRVQELHKEELISQEGLEQARLEMTQADWRLRQSELEEDERQAELKLGQNETMLIEVEQIRSLNEIATLLQELQQQESRLSSRLNDLGRRRSSRFVRANMRGVVVSPSPAKLLRQRIAVGDEILTIVDPASISFIAMVPEESVVKVRLGQDSIVELNALPKRKFSTFRGTVTEIGQEPTDEREGAVLYPVHIRLRRPWVRQNAQRLYFRSGMQGLAQIVYQKDAQIIDAWIEFFSGS